MKFVIYCKNVEAKVVVRDSEATSYPCEDGEEGRRGSGWGRAALSGGWSQVGEWWGRLRAEQPGGYLMTPPVPAVCLTYLVVQTELCEELKVNPSYTPVTSLLIINMVTAYTGSNIIYGSITTKKIHYCAQNFLAI